MQDPTQTARDYLAHQSPTGPLWLAMTDTAARLQRAADTIEAATTTP